MKIYKCKRDYCQEPRYKGNKYCKKHWEEYLEKKRKYEEIQKTLSSCKKCANKVSPSRTAAGLVTCKECGDIEAKNAEFESIDNIKDLKNWMIKNIKGIK